MHNRIRKIAIIPARGGSKRIPRKNIKDFLGKPIIAYSIEAAQNSCLFDEVMVSTEDSEIADIGKSFGATVPFLRSLKNSDDFASTASVIIEVLDGYSKIMNRSFDIVCCIYPTAPFVTSTKLNESYQQLINSEADSIMPVVKFSYPPQRGLIKEKGSLIYREPTYINSRSQDLEEIFHDAGQFYWSKIDKLLEFNMLAAGQCIPYELSEMEVQDLDSRQDWELALLKYGLISQTRRNL